MRAGKSHFGLLPKGLHCKWAAFAVVFANPIFALKTATNSKFSKCQNFQWFVIGESAIFKQ